MKKIYIIQGEQVINDKLMIPVSMEKQPQLFVEVKKPLQTHFLPLQAGFFMIDLDAPTPNHPSKSPLLHWLNFSGKTEVPYMGPHPPPNSPPHRYVIYQVNGNLRQDFSMLREMNRYNFPYQSVLRHFGLEIVAVGSFSSSESLRAS